VSNLSWIGAISKYQRYFYCPSLGSVGAGLADIYRSLPIVGKQNLPSSLA
jgi:hypothetical protein